MKCRKNKIIATIMSVAMVGSMFTGIGTKEVNAATYTSGTVTLMNLKAGDTVYKGVQLNSDRQVAICAECKMIWITTGGADDYGIGDQKNSEIDKIAPHSGHTNKTGYTRFNWYFDKNNNSFNNPVVANTPYTVMENENIVYKITYNTNGGTTVSSATSSKIPTNLPTTTKEGYDFVGWYTDAALNTEAKPGTALSKDTTLYAKWKLHEHTYSENWTYDQDNHWHEATCAHSSEITGEEKHSYGIKGVDRYTCTVCGYVDKDKKENILAIENTKEYINAIGKVEYTNESKIKIDAARKAYDALTDEQKELVLENDVKTLTDAESRYAKLKADDEAAKAVVEKINAIGEVEYTEASQVKINEAREAYETLTKEQKEIITEAQYKVLTDAENTYVKLEADHKAANAVAEKIQAIGKVSNTAESKAKIDEARKAYDELSKEAKTVITKDQYKALADAESTYTKLKESAESKANTLAMNYKFSIKTGKSIKISWGKVKDADGYDVYLTYCGKGKAAFVKSTKSTSIKISKLMKKAIDQKKDVKCYVVAYKKVNGKKQQIGKTKVFHAIGKENKSVTEPKKIQLKKTSYILTESKKAIVKAAIVKKNKKLPMINHTEKFRYATTDAKVATVSKDGKITAKKKGTCYVYVYAVNGCAKKVRITVK